MRVRALLLLGCLVASTALAQVPDVTSFTATSGDQKITLRWTNPSPHAGVEIVRRVGGTPIYAPTNGILDLVGGLVAVALGDAIVYSEAGSSNTATSYIDTGLTNGTTYYYRIFNRNSLVVYSTGNVPTSAGIFAKPTAGTSSTASWCMSVGMASLQQPVSELGAATFTANNGGSITATVVAPGQSTDGSERWRPVQLGGAVGSRFPALPLKGNTGTFLVVGDQSGRVTTINSATGAVLWRANGNAALGDAILVQPVAQLYAYASVFFQVANPTRDLIFVATRNNSSTNNKVYALSSVDGSIVWTYAPGDLDVVSGAMAVDYANDRVWVAAMSNSGTQASVRILNSKTGAEVSRLSLGDVTVPLVMSSADIYIVNTSGQLYAYSMASMTQDFTYALGSVSSYPYPLGDGFIASLTAGSVARYTVSGTTVTRAWTTPISGPSGVRVLSAWDALYVGSSDGKVHQLTISAGTDSKQVTLSTGKVGMPTADTVVNRLAVGTLDGQLCSIPIPF